MCVYACMYTSVRAWVPGETISEHCMSCRGRSPVCVCVYLTASGLRNASVLSKPSLIQPRLKFWYIHTPRYIYTYTHIRHALHTSRRVSFSSHRSSSHDSSSGTYIHPNTYVQTHTYIHTYLKKRVFFKPSLIQPRLKFRYAFLC